MTAADEYLVELAATLRVRGRAKRRLLAECRDHLADASAVHGVDEAVRRFGPVHELARSFDTEVAIGRARRATVASVAGAIAVAGSALVMLHAAQPAASSPLAWAVVFFACAQTSAVSTFLAVLRAAALHGCEATPGDVALLCRRNGMGLAFALATLFAAGAAVPGQAPAWKILLGPVVALLAAVCVVRTHSLARRIDTQLPLVIREPVTDAFAVARRWVGKSFPVWSVRSGVVLAVTVVVAAAAAFGWGLVDDQGTLPSSLAAAAIEAALTVVGFMVLGPVLGLRAARHTYDDSVTT